MWGPNDANGATIAERSPWEPNLGIYGISVHFETKVTKN